MYLPLQLRTLRSRVSHHEDDESLRILILGALVPSLEYAHGLLLDSIVPLPLEPDWSYLTDTLDLYISNFFVEARGRLLALVQGPLTPNSYHSPLRASLYMAFDNIILDVESFKFLTVHNLQAIHGFAPPFI